MMLTKYFLKIFILYLSTFFLSVSAQEPIKEYKYKDNLYLVGDRVFSLYYITDDGVVVIDPISTKIAEETLKSIRRHTSLPIKYVIYSHNHWDHNMGGDIYRKEGAQFLTHEEAFKNFPPNPEVMNPDKTWKGNKKVLKVGEQSIELYYYGRNHGNGMTVFRFPEHNAVFTVDLVVPDRVLYAYLPDASPQNWLKDLYEIKKLNFQDLLMAHVRPIGSGKDLDLQIQYFEDLYRETQKALDAKIPLFEIPAKVKMPQYENLQNYNEWLHMNVWRILMEMSTGV
ncbi:MBL fold metallo-hydrolase [Chryseobacterium caseinilyticum]|uniref:MBL fold metallo-hydrolase n=1 Tax=Chryseobacterium caseinilyticum TaxID=2771428 RepID=A0ABR8ZIA2_9FLAO|nr:MBL fold metallo-hydrolase [Chryseobacterium caseinilyticum]MBD8084538.1 MBL fold metallo-hydrolase [Chryseobacterium caseinilyticum]